MPADARDAFLSAFSGITGTGLFHSAGTAPFFFPQLHVKKLGELAFPLPEAQAEALIALAETAPYGLGEKTVLDENVRKCWQLDASQFSFQSPQWKKLLDKTVSRVREDLGIRGKISAHPYQLLVYGKGGHFKAHRDTEKLDAMFGTLIVALPSAHEGGRLFIRHGGREIEVDFSREEHRHEFQHAAFFADCEHEVEPVRSGYRCCLVYNLRLDEGDPAALNLPLDAQARGLLPSLDALKRESPGELSAVLLEHSYTEANFSLRNLKGNDQARARALFAAAKEAGLDAHLGLVTFHQTGTLEGGGYGYDDNDPEDGTMGEIIEEYLAIDHWRDARDRSVDLGSYGIDGDVIISREPIGEGDPDEKEAEGFTGNAGCTMDYWYRRAAIVLWAAEDREEIVCRYTFPKACAALAALAARKETGPPFHRLAAAIVARYPEELPPAAYTARLQSLTSVFPDGGFDEGKEDRRNPFAVTLDALAKAGSREWLDRLLGRVPASAFAHCDAALWARLHEAFGVDAFSPVYEALLAGGVEESRRTLFQTLAGLLALKDGAPWSRKIAGQLSRLAPQPPRSHWDRRRDPAAPGDPAEAGILLAASHLLDGEEDRRAALAFLRADSSLSYIREVLGPVLLEKSAAKSLAQDNSLAPDVLAFAKDLLVAETTRPLGPYPDWTRPCPQDGRRSHHGYRSRTDDRDPIRELVAFMADPDEKIHNFSRSQDERTLLENYIRDHFLDLDHVTLKRSRPYTLQCTKNDKSYHHALAWRARDEALLKKLGELG